MDTGTATGSIVFTVMGALAGRRQQSSGSQIANACRFIDAGEPAGRAGPTRGAFHIPSPRTADQHLN